jgi:hypothetical protein
VNSAILGRIVSLEETRGFKAFSQNLAILVRQNNLHRSYSLILTFSVTLTTYAFANSSTMRKLALLGWLDSLERYISRTYPSYGDKSLIHCQAKPVIFVTPQTQLWKPVVQRTTVNTANIERNLKGLLEIKPEWKRRLLGDYGKASL